MEKKIMIFHKGEKLKCSGMHIVLILLLMRTLIFHTLYSKVDCRSMPLNICLLFFSRCQCDRQFVNCLRSVKTRISTALGRVFFNIAGMTCYKYEHPVKRCMEYVDVPKNHIPLWILSASNINRNPKRPR